MVFALVCAAIGLLVGPALAFIAELVPDRSGGGQSPRQCRNCQVEVSTFASYLPFRTAASQCPNCEHQISAGRLPIVLATGAIFAAVGNVIGPRWQVIPVLFLSAAIIALSAVDLTRYRLPDKLLFPSLGIGIVLLGVFAFATGTTDHFIRGLVAMLAYSLVLFIPNLIMPAGLAFGDVKLALLLGLFLGWTADTSVGAARLVIWAFLIGLVFGVFTGIVVGVGRRVFGHGFLPDPDFPPPEDGSFTPLLKTAMPFGPALAFAALLLILFSERFLSGASILAHAL